MSERLQLPSRHREQLEALFREHLPDVEVWAYGSRVDGRSHDGSDLDLVLRGPGLEEIDLTRLADFEQALHDSAIPFLVEARDWALLPERFHREIEREYVEVVPPSGEDAGLHETLYRPRFPRHWRRYSLYALATWMNGIAFRDISSTPTGMPVIKISEIKGGITGQTRFTHQTFDESVRVRPGDLLFSWSGQPEESIDAFVWRGSQGWLNQHVFRVTPVAGVDPTFFFYLLRYLRRHFVAIARNKQTTGLGHVTKQDLKDLKAAVPSPREQREIAQILGTLDEKIELSRRMSETLGAKVRALFNSWFVNFDPVRAKMLEREPALSDRVADLFPDRLVGSETGDVPAGWEIVPLTKIMDINPTRRLRKGDMAPYLGMSAMPTRGHCPDSVTERPYGSGTRFVNGDTLLARITPCLENGKTAYVDFLSAGETGWGSTEYIVMRPKLPLPTEFAYCLARSSAFRHYAIQNMTGTSGRQRVSAAALAHFRLPVPPVEIAVQFGVVARDLLERASKASCESQALRALRDALLPPLLSGSLRVGGSKERSR